MSEEIERTEELLEPVKNHGRKKKMVVISIAIILIIISGIGISLISSNIKDSNYKKQLYLGNKYLEEGIYSEAILAFDKAIEIEGKLPEAYEMKAKACIANGDYEAAKEIYFKLYDESGDDHFKELENNVGMGNTPGNLANGGLAAKSEEAIYIGNKPKAGNITRIKNEEEIVIFEIEGNVGKYVCDLNISGEWIYFRVANMGGTGLAEEKPQNGIYKVKIDGTGFTTVKLLEETGYYYDLTLQENNIFVLSANKGLVSLYKMNLNGEDSQKIVNVPRLSAYAVDGENLYYLAKEGIVCINKNDSKVLREEGIMNSVISCQMFVNNGRLYYLINGENGENILYSMNTDGTDNKVVIESAISDKSTIEAFNIINNQIYYSKAMRFTGASTADYKHILEIRVRDLNNDTDQILIQEKAKDSDLGYTSLDGIYAYVDKLTLIDNRIYYEVPATSGAGGFYRTFFRMNQDGTENEVISLK